MMGALSNVLNVISPDCAANCENVATDAAAVQNPRKRRGLNVEEDKNVKTKEKKVEAFQMGVVASLSSISISQKEETLQKEEAIVRGFKLQMTEAGISEKKKALLSSFIDNHLDKVIKLEEEIKEMKAGCAHIMRRMHENPSE